ncbi:MAG: elongation factor P maturation arginine rhamnosyltransferase EarP, partial [Comamonadaceae bacterium]
MKTGNLWDIFCRVIDNYGDVGVCWRLAADLAARGEQVRLWLDDASALAWMAPGGTPGVSVRQWNEALSPTGLPAGDVLIEAFGCEVDAGFLAGHDGVWLNLEYLSAEAYVEPCHGLPSPVLSGPGAGLRKYFFYPGFTPATGGLLREPGLAARQAAFDREAWLRRLAIHFQGERLISLFCYEPAALQSLLEQLAAAEQPTRLLVTPGRATAAV